MVQCMSTPAWGLFKKLSLFRQPHFEAAAKAAEHASSHVQDMSDSFRTLVDVLRKHTKVKEVS